MSNKSIQRVSSLKFSRMLKRNKTISQINVTPMVDVMLVLLVIFMITAPLLKVGVPINLPKTKAKALPEDQTPLSITINKEEKIGITVHSVFPEPVGAIINESFFSKILGDAFFCISVNCSKPNERNFFSRKVSVGVFFNVFCSNSLINYHTCNSNHK